MNLGSLIRRWVGLGADALAYQDIVGWDGTFVILLLIAFTFLKPSQDRPDPKD